MKKTFRIGILGCRARGSAAALAYLLHPRTEVVAVCDLDRNLRDSLGDRLNLSQAFRFGDLDDMIRESKPDIVVIATGTEFHHSLAMRVVAHGVHIDLEKPICATLEEADELIDAADRAGITVAVHHQNRIGPGMRAMGEALREGRIGQLRCLHASDKGYYGGLGLMNIGVHLLSYLFELGGRVRRVAALGSTGGRPCKPEDVRCAPLGMGVIVGEHITATLDFGGNVSGVLLLHRFGRNDNLAVTVEAQGERGRLFWGKDGRLGSNLRNRAWSAETPYDVPPLAPDTWQRLEESMPAGFDPESGVSEEDYCFVDEFVRALDEGRDHRCSGAEGRHALEVMMAIFEAVATGRVVDLPQTNRRHPLLHWREEAGLGPPVQGPRGYTDWLAAEDLRIGRIEMSHAEVRP